ncbi:unnamed protein product [Cyclocybe aegerita]|uniref:MYND-type domain-containing protein n=1 Tax=Cyclocybe aegerita TaxID=1973307 RepID=A0A8S0WF96_CYCAE|nr:unnamed protein product [Cyclocybe aegerita]
MDNNLFQSTDKECIMCNKSRQCPGCQAKLYCSQKCRAVDAPVHILLCSSRQNFETRPHQNARRAIIFEQGFPSVKFAWIDIKIESDEDDGIPWEKALLDDYLGTAKFKKTAMYDRNTIRQRRTKEIIGIKHWDTFLVDGSPVNQTVAAVAPATGGPVWAGPLVAMKIPKSNFNNFLDLDMRDLRDLVDMLAIYGQPQYAVV